MRDFAIQRSEHDLVIGTFGRGVYILDDYTPLRTAASGATAAAGPATLFPVRRAVLYVPTQRYGGARKAFRGELFYAGDNPPYGALITYQLKDSLKTLKQKRVDAEKAAEKSGQPIHYATADELRAEDQEEAPAILLSIADSAGKAIRVITGPVAKGFQRVAWDLRLPAHVLPPPPVPAAEENPFENAPAGPYVVPGKYSVTLAQRVLGVVTPLAGPISFEVVADAGGTATLADHAARWQFQQKEQELRRSVAGALELTKATQARLTAIVRALDLAPAAPLALPEQARALQKNLAAIIAAIRGDSTLRSRNEPSDPSIADRVNGIDQERGRTLGRATATHERQYELARGLYGAELTKLRQLVQADIPALERELEKAGAPYTPGRVPDVPVP